MSQQEGKRWTRKDSKHERQIRVCRHHGETEFYFSSDNRNQSKALGGTYKCLACQRVRNKRQKEGIKVKPTPGCSNYVGLYIAERVLKRAFDVMTKSHPMDAWDFICGNGFTVNSKCSTLRIKDKSNDMWWQFHIEKNKTTKFFCLIALDNTPVNVVDDPRPIHVWLIPGDAIIDGRPLNDRVSLNVSPRTMQRLEPYRRTDMEGKIIKCCNHLKDNES